MTPKVGDVFMLDLGYGGKVRPVVIMSREDANAPRALSLFVPLTKQSRNSRYEIEMPRVPWLKLQSYANVQAISWAEHNELTDKADVLSGLSLKQSKTRFGMFLSWTD